jgi:FAD/FMN-containing dehydrogenase
MNAKILDGLKTIVGEDFVSQGPDAVKKFLRPGREAPGLVVVSPSVDKDVQEIINLARENNVAIITKNDRYVLEEDLRKEGILLDFSRMNRIERIDARNLIVHVQRGVTWEQLIGELKKEGIKAAWPVAANSDSVAESGMARSPGKNISKFGDYTLTNLKLVMADGEIFKTGTHGFNEDSSDGRSEGGPNLSNWHFGADDIFGVMTRASIILWPECECRDCLVYVFDEQDELLKAMKETPRIDLGIEYLGINATALGRLLSGNRGDYPEYVLVIGFDSRTKLVEHNKDRVAKFLERYSCRPEASLVEAMSRQLDLPWTEASDNHTAFYCRFSNLRKLDSQIDNAAAEQGLVKDDVGKIFTSYDHGRAVYAAYDLFSDKDLSGAIDSLNMNLFNNGALFDRPHGELGRKIYTGMSNHLPLLKHIKSILDPNNVLNPGRILKDEDEEWQPLSTGDGEIGLTIANLKQVREKLEESVGASWVSDNPADLNCYSRDFTIFSGERPNIVVLPETVEDVQNIVKIAYEHGVPIVPLSTGFNHGGLSISRKGGIILDLKRMKHTNIIDPESMTATVSPGVRMRSLWWDSVKHEAVEGFHLKPILPLTFGSVSMLSNYISRGGAGTAFKYGNNSDLVTGMTWVLPNGEIVKVGSGAISNVGMVPINHSIGPDVFGMFFNADGMFGVCAEITVKLYPEKDNVEELEDLITSANPDNDFHHAFCQTIDAIHDLAHENITDFMYKAHPGLFALAIINAFEGMTIPGVIGMAPQHPLTALVSGYDVEELEIKKEIVNEIVAKYGLFILDQSTFGDDVNVGESISILKKSLGVESNFAGTYKGAFQWTACFMKMDLIPEVAKEYDELVKKYWKTSDPTISVEHAMTGTDIQGPLPYGRMSGVEFDFWWDQGNPEHVKRATTMLHKTQKLMLKHGGSLFRNMFGAGEYHLPLWGEYYRILKDVKKAFDPANLMHPDVMPITDDYI